LDFRCYTFHSLVVRLLSSRWGQLNSPAFGFGADWHCLQLISEGTY